MKIAYLDLFSGLAGDMFLAMLADAGLPLAALRRELRRLPLREYAILASRVRRGAVRCTHIDVRVQRPQAHERRASDILRMIRRSGIAPRARERALAAFERLARAEGAVHGVPASRVHLHEVGAVDSIVDVVGTCVGLELLGIDRVYGSPVPVCHADIRMEHGVLPGPGSATLRLLEGFPLREIAVGHEVVTPTGAALLAALVTTPGRFPAMTLERVGYGAGTNDPPGRPNFSRILIGEAVEGPESDLVWELSANLDDATGEEIAHVAERLRQEGALDVWLAPVQMKKGRPGVVVTLLAAPDRAAALERLLLRESSTFGVRRHLVERSKLDREVRTTRTRYGPIRVKVGRLGGEVVQASPEYEDLRRAATRHGVPLARVAAAVARLRGMRSRGGLTRRPKATS